MTLKVLHIDSEKGWSGGETQVKALMDHLRQNDFTNAIACPDNSVIAKTCLGDGYKIFEVRMRNSVDILSIMKLAKVMKAFTPDIVHMHASKAHFLGLWAVWLARMECVTVVTRRMDYKLRKAFFMRFSYSWKIDKVVAISKGVQNALEASGVKKDQIEVIHSGIDLSPFDKENNGNAIRKGFGIQTDAKVIGIVGSLVKRKGHKYTLLAMPEILRTIPNVMLLIAGDGPKRGELEDAAKYLGIDKHVIFMGRTERIPEVLAGLDLLLLPSWAEGLGISILEGMAMNLPIIGTTVGGIPDAVHDQVNGFLVPPRDSGAIAKRSIQILTDTELSARMGREGRALVQEQFSASLMAERNRALYFRLLKDKWGAIKSPTK